MAHRLSAVGIWYFKLLPFLSIQILIPINWMYVHSSTTHTGWKIIIFPSASFAESSPFVLRLQALDSLMKRWHVLMTGRELWHFCSQGYCLISDWDQHTIARTLNYCRQNTGHFEAGSSEFLSTKKNEINMLRGFYAFLQYKIDHLWWKAAMNIWGNRCLQYLTESLNTSVKVLRFSQSDSTIPASLQSFAIRGVTTATMRTCYKHARHNYQNK